MEARKTSLYEGERNKRGHLMERKEGSCFVVSWVNLLPPTMATNGAASSCQINPVSPSLVIYSIDGQAFPTKAAKYGKNMLCEKAHAMRIRFQKTSGCMNSTLLNLQHCPFCFQTNHFFFQQRNAHSIYTFWGISSVTRKCFLSTCNVKQLAYIYLKPARTICLGLWNRKDLTMTIMLVLNGG